MFAASLAAEPRDEEVMISFVKSKDGKIRTIPVWFAVYEGKMDLLPMYGSKTKWLGDVEKSGKIGLSIRDWRRESKPKILKDSKAIDDIKRRFSVKYGESQVKRYYPTQDVALEIQL
jgi:hypothetical protein